MLTKKTDFGLTRLTFGTTVNIRSVKAQGELKIKMFDLFRQSLKLRNENYTFPAIRIKSTS